ncbi:phosphotyrosine protein phosphatase [Halomonas sp. 1513]|nr:low molecular weight protein-tyrosine-phosphatase [Halomonas sp. 1513]APX93264.1 phosphotyrosine protein phosphatase [Halomonas sp. 1513]
MFERILVVCTGNICRSPVGEALLRQQLPAKQVSSAGLGALVGHGVEPQARQLAEAEGLDVSAHQARQLTVEMLQQHDLILVMSDGQRLAVGEMLPAAMGKTMLFGRWLGGAQGEDIPDPYRKSPEVFQHVHQLLTRAADAWAHKL